MKKPNILFAIADDASHMSAYGHKFLKTPAFDNLAKRGIRFDNAFCTNPKCAPSRASILTGRYTWQLAEASCHQGVFPNRFKVYPDILEKNGYHIGYTGKGWAPGDYLAGGFKRNPAGNEYNQKTLIPPSNSCISNIDYTANFIDFMEHNTEDKPFCFWYGGIEPHRPYKQGEGERGLTDDIEEINVPKYLPCSDIVKKDFRDYASEIEWFDMHLANIIDYLKLIGEYENTLIVATSDNGAPFPRIKGQMYEQDFRLPLAICWENMIKPNQICDELVSFTDFAPTFLDIAKIEKHPQFSGKSLMPIFLETGENFREFVTMGREHHDFGSEDDLGYPVRCLRTQEFLYVRNLKPNRWPAGNPETNFTNCDSSPTKDLVLELKNQGEMSYFNYCFGKRPYEELYNIKEDEQCIENLAESPLYQTLKNELSAKLDKFLTEHKDPRIIGDGDIFETYKFDPLKAQHSWANYKNGTWKKQRY